MVAARQSERGQWEEEFLHGDWKRVKEHDTSLEYQIRLTQNELHLLCKSKGRLQKDLAIRKKAVEKMEGELKKLQNSVIRGSVKKEDVINRRIGRIQQKYPRANRYFDIEFACGQLKFQQIEDKVNQAEEFDGTYLLKSSKTDLQEQDIWFIYVLLTRVELAFEYLNSDLGLRPIFHQKPERIEGHLFISVLAYVLLNQIETTLRHAGDSRQWKTIRDELTTHQRVTVRFQDKSGKHQFIRINSNPEANHQEIYHHLNIVRKHFPAKKRTSSQALNTLDNTSK